jgi:sec-independent protein translocase protein TatB
MTGIRPLLIGDIGFGELVVIAFVGVLVFGPDKLPVLAKQAGQMARRVRDFATSARDELRSELGEDYADLELRDLDPRTIVRRHIIEAMEAGDDEETATRRVGQRPLAAGEVPPYDVEST